MMEDEIKKKPILDEGMKYFSECIVGDKNRRKKSA
jgi:hypothetical protein